MRSRVLLIVLLAASAAFAQRGGGRGGGGGGGGIAPQAGPVIKNHLEILNDALQLSKEQKKDIKALMDAAQKEATPLREQLVKGRAQIATAVQGGKQEEIDAAVKSYSQLDGQMSAIEMKAFAGVYKTLDAEQKQKARSVFMMMTGIFTRKNWVDVDM
jgi:Spy/CpxP family protein refolding chaperone